MSTKYWHDIKIAFLSTIDKGQARIKKLYVKHGNQSWIHDLELDIKAQAEFYNMAIQRDNAHALSTSNGNYTNTHLRNENKRLWDIILSNGFEHKDMGYLKESDYMEMKRNQSINQAYKDFNL